jgi:hypothetical protein
MIKTIKQKACKVCGENFIPFRSLENWCSPAHGAILGAAKLEKAKAKEQAADRKETRAKLKEKKEEKRGYWLELAQKEFNSFIRLRDQIAGHACISSGRPLNWSGNQVDAGHFRSRGSAPHMRFVEENVHAQSKYENRYMSGNAPGYRVGLIARIGLEAVEALEADQEPRRYTIDDLKAIKQTYADKVRALKGEK